MQKQEEIKLSTEIMLEASENAVNFTEGILSGIQAIKDQKSLKKIKEIASIIESCCIKVLVHESKKQIELNSIQVKSGMYTKN